MVPPPQVEKRAFRIDEFCAAYGIGRTKTYQLIKMGKLRSVLVGSRRLVPWDAAEQLLASPVEETKSETVRQQTTKK